MAKTEDESKTPTASTTVNFSSEEGDDYNSISIELDDDHHITLYQEAKTEFKKTELVYLKVVPSFTVKPYEILVSNGSCVKKSTNNPESITDLLAFENTKEAQLSDFPIGAVITNWVAGEGGAVLTDERKISTSSKAIGILKCVYEREFDRLELTTSLSMTDDQIVVMVGNEEDDEYASITVDYTGEGTVLRNITLEIKDIVTDELISNASVIVKKESVEVFSGTTGETGKVTISDMIVGASYDLEVTATDYIDSNNDYLNNDSFTVPEP